MKNSWSDFVKLFLVFSRSEKEVKALLDLFLTPEEKEMLSSRYQIISALLEGKLTQREIAQKYRVSIAQITRGSNALKSISPNLKKSITSSLSES